MEAKAYPSDLSDEQWELLKDFVAQGKMGRPRTVNIREVINAILYVVKTGCQWRALPGGIFLIGKQSTLIFCVGVTAANGRRFMTPCVRKFA